MSKDDIIRFRCDSKLRARFEAIAKEKRREPADLARIIFEDYIAAEEGGGTALREDSNSYPVENARQTAKSAAYKISRSKKNTI